MSYVRHRSLTTHLVIVLIASWTSTAWAGQGHDHEKDATQKTAPATAPAGDPYSLDTDPVTGDKLPNVSKQIIIDHEGRELRFGTTESAEQFKQDPAQYLPSVDEQIAAQQLPYYPLDTCVVTGDKLGGGMGDPINFIYKNRLIRFCCPMCKGSFKEDPAKFLGMLDEAVKSRQADGYPLKTCPVSGMKLGGEMGDPIDIVLASRLVRLCCQGCDEKLRADPVKYLGVLGDHGREHDSQEVGEDHSEHDAADQGEEHGQTDHSNHNH